MTVLGSGPLDNPAVTLEPVGDTCNRYGRFDDGGCAMGVLSIRALPALCAGLLAVAGVLAAPAAAQFTPQVKPSRPHTSTLLSPADAERLRLGLRAAERADWDQVRMQAARLTDPTAQRILLWRAAVSDYRATFDDLSAALNVLDNWPRVRTIQSQAEARMPAADLSARRTIAWFKDRPPVSGEGKIRLAEAYLNARRRDEGVALLKETWRSAILPRAVQTRTARRHSRILTRQDHEARVDYLLWRGHRSDAWALRDYISSDWRKLTLARIRLMARQRGVDAAVAAVPADLREHPGLLFERARWRRRAGRVLDAEPLILSIRGPISPIAADKIWTERRIQTNLALKRGDYNTAYALAKDHGLERGVDFADAEWLAGWLALRKLSRPDVAETHFAVMQDKVTTPISKSRAAYWLARAAAAQDQGERARALFADAAEYKTTYYGQLAMVELGGGADRVALPPATRPTPEDRAAFLSKDLVRALLMLAENDEPRLFRDVAFHLDDQLETPEQVILLSEVANDYSEPSIGVRGGKAGMMRGVVAPAAAYPVIDLPSLRRGAPEPALLLALMRQESEFDPDAVSHAGARGIMQLLPTTAYRTARNIGERYRRNWLTDDSDYNIAVGSSHLAELLDAFDGSYILAAAAYNAGSSRANRWIRDYGDPRSPNVDPIDWVESIPFSETRNYVQRVMEGLQVYRARLDNGRLEASLYQDLRRGG